MPDPIDLTDAFEEDERVLGATQPYPPVDLPWDREPAPDATRPVSRESHEDAPEWTQPVREPTPAEVKADARQRAVTWAETALLAWNKALDWADIDDPTLPGDYPVEAKGIADFIARVRNIIERS